MKRFLRYFLQGLVFVVPVGFTLYIIVSCIQWIDNIIPRVIESELPPGGGLAIMVAIVTVFGYLGSTLIAKPMFSIFENYIYKLPLVNIIYSSTKDVIGAFVGDKKKFDQPVLVLWNKEAGTYRIGFITQNDLKYLEILDKVAVYFPDSYNISGNLFLIERDHFSPINASSSEIMKFIVSGGVSGLNN
ncbi:MAG TPA: DUF502 domain-containing protein [Cytophagaceae bacterium]|jgi:uncharacterized membrane protein